MTHAVTQTVVLAVVDEVVVDVMPLAFYQVNAGMREGRYLAIIHFESGMFGLNAYRSGKLIVIRTSVAARTKGAVMLCSPPSVRRN